MCSAASHTCPDAHDITLQVHTARRTDGRKPQLVHGCRRTQSYDGRRWQGRTCLHGEAIPPVSDCTVSPLRIVQSEVAGRGGGLLRSGREIHGEGLPVVDQRRELDGHPLLMPSVRCPQRRGDVGLLAARYFRAVFPASPGPPRRSPTGSPRRVGRDRPVDSVDRVRLGGQPCQNRVPGAASRPPATAFPYRLRGTERFAGQISPGDSGAVAVDDPFDDATVVGERTPCLPCVAGKAGRQACPLFVGQQAHAPASGHRGW